MTEMTLCIDPGITTGWALFGGDGKCVDYGQIAGIDNLQEFLIIQAREGCLTLIIYEGYKIWPKGAKKNQKSGPRRSGFSANERKGHEETLKAVGKIEAIGTAFGITLLKVEPAFKYAGYRQGNIPPATNHKVSHERDAIAIGVHHFVKEGILQPQRIPLPPKTEGVKDNGKSPPF